MVDDGLASRGNRKTIFNKDFDSMGCFSGSHKKYERMTVINYCAGWLPKDSKITVNDYLIN